MSYDDPHNPYVDTITRVQRSVYTDGASPDKSGRQLMASRALNPQNIADMAKQQYLKLNPNASSEALQIVHATAFGAAYNDYERAEVLKHLGLTAEKIR